jgi:hypothetical protein
MTHSITIVVPTGALGSGVSEALLRRAFASGRVDGIACDAGSTDSGPAYLASGQCKYSREAVKRDLDILMRARSEYAVPLLIGSCGTSGSDQAVDWTRDIALEIAAELDMSVRIALLYSEQSAALLTQRAQQGRIDPLAPMTTVDLEAITNCEHIVALMGPEPYVAALNAGAEIVLGGRSTDAGVLAAVPLMHGVDAGPAWHAGKTAECGGLCTVDAREGGVLVRVDSEGFEVEPLSASNRCTTESVSAHLLYENTDAFLLREPGGIVDVTSAAYVALDERRVRVSGSRFVPGTYTMKLEGAAANGFQTLMLVGIRDPQTLRALPRFLAQMHGVMVDRVCQTLRVEPDEFHISLRPYGSNAVCEVDDAESAPPPREIGLLFVATAGTQHLATQVAKICNPVLFHMPLDLKGPLPSYAFPFSPAEVERGAVYEFKLNHVVQVDDPLELVRTIFVNTRVSA